MKVVSTNKFASHNYFLLETFEAGVVLLGSEIKSIRQNGIVMNESFILISGNKVILKNSFVKPYQTTNSFSPKPDRDRQLLLNLSEILKLKQAREQKGLTIIPVKAYIKDNLLKIEIAIARGKKLFNKKDDLREQDIKREAQRAISKM